MINYSKSQRSKYIKIIVTRTLDFGDLEEFILKMVFWLIFVQSRKRMVSTEVIYYNRIK